ncbi:MAG TPA: translation elongation factor Ts [Candidatus Saccharimonadales bacterium]
MNSNSKKELIKELRAITSAGMVDCVKALEESSFDLQKAVDIVKVKGLNIADGRTGRVAADGLVDIVVGKDLSVMVEVNCQTDFVAGSAEFKKFIRDVKHKVYEDTLANVTFSVSSMEEARKEVVSKTKENVVIRRWFAEQALDPTVKVFAYEHSNSKIGVLLTMRAPSVEAANSPEFQALGDDLTMQICAMNPLAISADRLPTDEVARQKAIFETQLKEDKKPEAMWGKIMEGKMRKWNTEVCLLEQESVSVAKTLIKQVVKNVGSKLGGEIQIVNFVRCQVGEGIEIKKENLAEEVAKLTDTRGC